MSKQENNDIVENIKNVFDKYKNLVVIDQNFDKEELSKIENDSVAVLREVNNLRKILLIISTTLTVVVIASLFAFYKLQVAYDQIYDLKLEQTETKFDSINKVITGLKFIANQKVKDTNTVSYYSRKDGTIITYQDMSDLRDTLFKENQRLKNDYQDIKAQLDLIKKYYPIKTTVKKYTKNKSQRITYIVESKKIDEALYFYEQYKDKVEEIEKKSN